MRPDDDYPDKDTRRKREALRAAEIAAAENRRREQEVRLLAGKPDGIDP